MHKPSGVLRWESAALDASEEPVSVCCRMPSAFAVHEFVFEIYVYCRRLQCTYTHTLRLSLTLLFCFVVFIRYGRTPKVKNHCDRHFYWQWILPPR